jgi:hypothetical protein
MTRYSQVYSWLHNSFLKLLHLSAAICSHLQGARTIHDTYSVLYTLSNIDGKIFKNVCHYINISIIKYIELLKLYGM